MAAGRIRDFLTSRDMQPKCAPDAALAAADQAEGLAIHVRDGVFKWAEHTNANDAAAGHPSHKSKRGKTKGAKAKPAPTPAAPAKASGAGAGAGGDGDEGDGGEESFEALTLEDLGIKKGEFVAVVGKVASGKTSLLMALLSEIPRKQGRVDVYGSVSYVPQQPWVMNATVRDNVTYQTPFDGTRYRAALRACQMEHDVKVNTKCLSRKGHARRGHSQTQLTIARCFFPFASCCPAKMHVRLGSEA